MLVDQKHCCQICERHITELPSQLVVDHCHQTNEVRGLLCYNCNTLLGVARDQIKVLENGIKYLQKNNH